MDRTIGTIRLVRVAVLFAGALLAQTKPPAAAALPSKSPAEMLNAELPKWLGFSGEIRTRLEGFENGAFRGNNDDLYLLTRVRVNMRITPTPWLKLFAQGQDARVFWKNQNPARPPFQDTMDLRQAYVEIGDTEKKSMGVRVGRQELVFGEQRLIGHVSWLNTARSFDAARATFAHKGYKLDAWASSVVVIKDGEFNKRVDGDNFHGLYGAITAWIPKSVVEPYVLWRVNRVTDFFTTGARVAGKLPKSFDYSIEMAKQTGKVAKNDFGAWAGHWLIGYTLATTKYTPRLIAEYNYASGDKDTADKKLGTFDQLYPTPHDKIGLADQVGWKNVSHVRFGTEIKLTKKLMLNPNYHNIWLANAHDGLYGVNSALVVRKADGSAGTHIGQEIDGQVFYPLNKQVGMAFGVAHLFPGEFLKKATPGKSYTMPYAMLTYTF
ncbi:MAG: alginate export family protein [Bryobacteraceae bacterium]